MTTALKTIVGAALALAFAPSAIWAQATAAQPAATSQRAATASQPADPATVLQGAERIGSIAPSTDPIQPAGAAMPSAPAIKVLPPGSIGKPLLWLLLSPTPLIDNDYGNGLK